MSPPLFSHQAIPPPISMPIEFISLQKQSSAGIQPSAEPASHFQPIILLNTVGIQEATRRTLNYKPNSLFLVKKTSWNHHAIIYDEKPNSLRVSTKQRTRWAQGHWFVAFSSILVQFFTLIRSKSLRELNSRIENIFYSFSMLSPLLGLIITISALIFKSEYNYVLPIWDLVLLWILLDSYRFIVLPIFTIFNELPKNFQSKKNKSL